MSTTPAPTHSRPAADLEGALRQGDRRWLVTGVAGFIGSNILERLLRLGQTVVGLDNFATGSRENLADVRRAVGESAWARFDLVEGDIRDVDACRHACTRADVVLHQAALGSVPRSIVDPLTTNAVNVDGFVNVLAAARDAGVSRVVYASSSSVYGDSAELPKVESRIGRVLSPYAASKYANEIYAAAFGNSYGMTVVGLRYFNVFGPRQDPEGPYAAVIPRWTQAMLDGETCTINGDGLTSRDFCYVDNAVQANLLAAVRAAGGSTEVYNVAFGARTTLNELYEALRARVADAAGASGADIRRREPVHGPVRAGDIAHSHADISRARNDLGYAPTHDLGAGLDVAVPWYARHRKTPTQAASS